MNSYSFSIGAGGGFVPPSQAPEVRPPAVAGQFYPAQAGELGAMIERCLLEAPSEPLGGPLRALIAPHAGYAYSGKCAAAGFQLLSRGQFSRVLVIGPSHYIAFRGASVPRCRAFRTPLGEIPVDADACAALWRCEAVTDDPAPHAREHSVEVELPFLQARLGEFRLIPLVTGQMSEQGRETLADALAALWDQRTLVVASSDFCHYGPNFRYEPFGRGQRERIAHLDASALEQILALNASGFEANVALTRNTICGHTPIHLLLLMARKSPRPLAPSLRSYYMSGDLFGDYENSVSYASVAFCEGAISAPNRELLGEEEQQVLRHHARSAVEHAARQRTTLQVERDGAPPRLWRAGAAFVTLTRKEDGQLRGCRGNIVPIEPLLCSVVQSAADAAIRDPRFPPVAPEELATLDLEVNVLAPPQRVRGMEEFVLGRHGLILDIGPRRGLFLPEVMVRQNWTPEETLCHLCRKAGAHPQAWRNGYRLYTFETQIIAGE